MITRVVWGVILGAPLLVWAFMAASALTRHAPPVRTGDALLDAFLQQLVDRDELASPVLRGAGPYFGTDTRVSDTMFASLERQYGDDPRFWMLCYRLRDPSADPRRSSVSPNTGTNYVGYLEEAETRGIADGSVLLILLQTRLDNWRAEAGAELNLTHPGRTATPGESYRYRNACRRQADSKHLQDERQLLEKVIEAAPDQALPHYFAAKYACERGDYSQAVAQVRRGNAATQSNPMLGFPQEITQAALHHQQVLGSSLITGWLAANVNYEPNFIRMKDFVKDMAYLAVQRKDARALDELSKLACRFGSLEGGDLITALVGAALVRVTFDEVQRDWPGGLSTSQQAKLKRLDAKYNHLRTACKAASAASNSRVNAMLMGPGVGPVTIQTLSSFFWGQLLKELTGRRGEALRYLEATYNDKLAEQQALDKQVRPLLDDIARFSYSEALNP